MILKGLRDEDFTQYKKPSMFVIFPSCSFKCCKEGNFPIEVCQNCDLVKAPNIEIDINELVERYMNNPITQAIVCGGMEPFDSWEDLFDFIQMFRKSTNDDVVIYTGFYAHEIEDKIKKLKNFPNIVIKFGRFVVDDSGVFDPVLGITLASSNQMGVKIS